MGKGIYISNTRHNMQVIIDKFGQEQVALDVSSLATVEELKSSLSLEKGLNENQIIILSEGIEIDNESLLCEFSTIRAEVSVDGEGKGGKRKKKIYKTAKRIPHKKTKVKMRALKYYSVQGNGEVKTTLKLCPEEMCKGGIFMSDHWNRCYCGRCQLTLIKENAPKEPPKKKVVVKEVVEEVKDTKKGGKKGK